MIWEDLEDREARREREAPIKGALFCALTDVLRQRGRQLRTQRRQERAELRARRRRLSTQEGRLALAESMVGLLRRQRAYQGLFRRVLLVEPIPLGSPTNIPFDVADILGLQDRVASGPRGVEPDQVLIDDNLSRVVDAMALGIYTLGPRRISSLSLGRGLLESDSANESNPRPSSSRSILPPWCVPGVWLKNEQTSAYALLLRVDAGGIHAVGWPTQSEFSILGHDLCVWTPCERPEGVRTRYERKDPV